MVKNGYYRNGLILAWDLAVIFLGIQNFAIFKKKIYFVLKRAMEKCVGYFLVYRFLRGFFD